MLVAVILLILGLVHGETVDEIDSPGWQVEVAEGRLDGGVKYVLGKEIGTFLGVPFARAPLGELRFRPPEPADKWKGGRSASQLAPACMCQPDETFPGFRGSEMWNANTRVTEDCLYLNIWAPKGLTNATTLVWIFGGGFVSGSPSLDLYEGSVLAATNDVIVVNIGYRTGPFGFLYFDHPEAPGNVGLLDQQMALRWISQNIRSFGGNPAKVAIFGESAGAASVSAHLIAPGSRGLFNFAILQSGTISNRWAHQSHQKALNFTQQLLKLVKCDQREKTEEKISCLRQIPAANLSLIASSQLSVASQGFFEVGFGPIDDDVNFFQGDFRQKLSAGDFKKSPVLVGINSDEGSYWLPYHMSDFIERDRHHLHRKDQFLKAIQTLFPLAKSSQVHRAIGYEYMAIPDCSHHQLSADKSIFREAINQIYGDFYFSCDVLNFADHLARHGVKVYQYHFDQRISSNPWSQWTGVMHGYEIEYIFGAPVINSSAFLEVEVEFSRRMMNFWSHFAKTGRPAEKQAEWPRYNISHQEYRLLRADFEKNLRHLKKDICAFWSSFEPTELSGLDVRASSSSLTISNSIATVILLPLIVLSIVNII